MFPTRVGSIKQKLERFTEVTGRSIDPQRRGILERGVQSWWLGPLPFPSLPSLLCAKACVSLCKACFDSPRDDLRSVRQHSGLWYEAVAEVLGWG